MIRINQWDCIKVENSNYGWQIMLGYEDKAGEFAPKMCKRMFGKNEKKAPISVPLGENPVEVLKTLLAMVESPEEESPF